MRGDVCQIFCRLNEIRVLKIKIGDLKRELHILKNSVANIDVLKHEVHHLGRELLQVSVELDTEKVLSNNMSMHCMIELDELCSSGDVVGKEDTI